MIKFLVHQIAWGVFFFSFGMLVGYMLKVVMNNYKQIKACSDNNISKKKKHRY